MQTPTQRLLAQIEADKTALQQQSEQMLKDHAASLNRLFNEEVNTTKGVMASQLKRLADISQKLGAAQESQQKNFMYLFLGAVGAVVMILCVFVWLLWMKNNEVNEWSQRAAQSQQMLEEAQKQAASTSEWFKKSSQTPSAQKPKNGK